MPDTRNMTPAQMYALVFGATLLLVGIIGFAVNADFDTGSKVGTGDKLIVFEVNGWHNLVHIASGLVGLAMFRRNDTARLYALGFGAVYLLVTIIGFADGSDVIGLIPVNGADNVLHLAIAALGIAAGLASPADNRTRTATA
jgi:hypothetical protein